MPPAVTRPEPAEYTSNPGPGYFVVEKTRDTTCSGFRQAGHNGDSGGRKPGFRARAAYLRGPVLML